MSEVSKDQGFREIFKEDKRFKIPLVVIAVLATAFVTWGLCTVKASGSTGGLGPGTPPPEEVPLTVTYAGTKGCQLRTFGRMAPPTRSTYRLELTVEVRHQGDWMKVLPGRSTGINRKGHKPALSVWLNPHQVERLDRHPHRVVIEQYFETTVRHQPDVPGATTAYGRTVSLYQADCEPDVTGQD